MSTSCFFFFNDTATTEIYTYGHTLSLHDALPISCATPSWGWCRCSAARSASRAPRSPAWRRTRSPLRASATRRKAVARSEEHTSELQSLMRISYAVFCLTKKKTHLQTHQSIYTSHRPENTAPHTTTRLTNT